MSQRRYAFQVIVASLAILIGGIGLATKQAPSVQADLVAQEVDASLSGIAGVTPSPTLPPTPKPTARPRYHTASASQPVTYGSGSINGVPCGGSLPPCSVLRRESNGNCRAENPNSSASGCWQFLSGTWNNYKNYPTAGSAPEHVQHEKARETWAGGRGCSHWNAC